MTLDLVILVVTALFALWGFFSGAAKQIAVFVAWIAAWAAAMPGGQFFGPLLTTKLATSAFVGVVLASLASFLVVFVVVQLVVAAVIRRLLAGRDPGSRTLDRLLGFGLGGGKVLAVMYVALCAMSFLEQNVVIMGRKLAFTPKDSKAMEFVHHYNLLEQQQFSGASDLAKVAQLAKDPKALQRLKDNGDFTALSKDPRFARVINAGALQKALETGDVRALINNNDVVELIHDRTAAQRLERLTQLR